MDSRIVHLTMLVIGVVILGGSVAWVLADQRNPTPIVRGYITYPEWPAFYSCIRDSSAARDYDGVEVVDQDPSYGLWSSLEARKPDSWPPSGLYYLEGVGTVERDGGATEGDRRLVLLKVTTLRVAKVDDCVNPIVEIIRRGI